MAAKNNENYAFHHKTATTSEYNCSLFQLLIEQIRYLADQRNIFADQRIKAALSTEKQWNSCAP
jgi:hypothetical protein